MPPCYPPHLLYSPKVARIQRAVRFPSSLRYSKWFSLGLHLLPGCSSNLHMGPGGSSVQEHGMSHLLSPISLLSPKH